MTYLEIRYRGLNVYIKNVTSEKISFAIGFLEFMKKEILEE